MFSESQYSIRQDRQFTLGITHTKLHQMVLILLMYQKVQS